MHASSFLLHDTKLISYIYIIRNSAFFASEKNSRGMHGCLFVNRCMLKIWRLYHSVLSSIIAPCIYFFESGNDV